MIKNEQKIIAASVLAGLAVWLIDAAVDTYIFRHAPFRSSLIVGITTHEFYFRTLLLICLIVFGALFSRALARRRQAEEGLKKAFLLAESEKAKADAIVAALGDGISIQDPDFTVLYQNEAHSKLVGDHVGEYCYAAYSRRDSICPDCPVAVSFQDGGIHTLERTRTDGDRTIHIEIKASSLRDPAGTIIAGIEVVRDITEHKRMEGTLVEQKRFVEHILENLTVAAFVVDHRHTIVLWNKACEELTGLSSADMIGTDDQWRPFYEAKRPTLADIVIDGAFQSLPTLYAKHARSALIPNGLQAEGWYGNLNGRERYIIFDAAPIYDSKGELIVVIETVQDISGRKRAEDGLRKHQERLEDMVRERTVELIKTNERLQQEIDERTLIEEELLRAQKLESLGTLAGGIAHDFNNFLAAIMGNISLAMLDIDPDDIAYTHLTNAENASLRARDLTQQLLTFSKGGEPVKTVLDLRELFEETAAFSLRGAKVKCEFLVSADLWLVEADKGQLAQVMNNLLINADNAMPAGGIISISGENRTLASHEVPPLAAGNYVKLTVRDCGIGIPREYLSKIFDPYFTTKQKGSGLGLSATYSIIKKHGGLIAVESALGTGTTFHIYLAASHATVVARRIESPKLLTGSGTILLMDDEESVRETTGEILRRLGYEVRFAEDGTQAISMYQEAMEEGKTFDLVIMDLTIAGGMGGKEAIKKLLDIDPKARAIVSSGYSKDTVMADYQRYGFMGVVSKPYRIKEISEAVHMVVRADMRKPPQGGAGAACRKDAICS